MSASDTAVYGRTSRHQTWKLLHHGSDLECQTKGDDWRAEAFDFHTQNKPETLTVPSAQVPVATLPRTEG